jgi:adenylate cyclase
MSEQFDHHKLTVIFYADVAGYSRLTAQDEQGTHQRVMAMLDYASDTITAAGGSVLRYAGDAILAEFPSILKAVQSAIDIQTESVQRNAQLSAEDPLHLRIGLNIGEVLQDRGEIYGDGVNLAARLEAAAQALSNALQVQPDLDMTFIRQALPITHAASAEHFYGGLIKAGVPE